MGRNLGGAATLYDVEAYLGTTKLREGDYVESGVLYRDGSAIDASVSLRDFYVQNGVVKVTYELTSPDVERGAHMLYRWDGDSYERAFSRQYGDWSYFAIGITVAADALYVTKCTEDEVVAVFQWTTFDLSTYGTGGVPNYDVSGNPNYASGQTGANYKKYASTKLRKVVRMKRGAEGYELAWHSDPRIGPFSVNLPTQNNTSDFGEREFGTGGGSEVVFSSAGIEGHHPDAGAHVWLGIDDAVNGEQEDGPWWAADLHYTNIEADGDTRIPFCRYMVQRNPIETGSWQFAPNDYGSLVAHYNNEWADEAGVPYLTGLFIGAFPYVSSDLDNEPTGTLKGQVARKAANYVWD